MSCDVGAENTGDSLETAVYENKKNIYIYMYYIYIFVFVFLAKIIILHQPGFS